jgi:hypothetical protein
MYIRAILLQLEAFKYTLTKPIYTPADEIPNAPKYDRKHFTASSSPRCVMYACKGAVNFYALA